jgi:23S rRNA C2498 (ribose-2'-O)-methylase RlmM
MNTFKTLAEARGAYEQLAAELAETQNKLADLAAIEAQLAEAKAFGSAAATENENFRLLIVQKDAEIAGLQRENQVFSDQVSELKNELETLQKNQKSAPVAVDQAEIAKMQAGTEREFVQAMAKETNPAELSRLYREYNRLFRPNGKTK